MHGESNQPGYLEGYGVIDADQVRELAATASLRLLENPPVSDAEALRYQPSAALERAIRCRDLTCRFPGCDRPASFCDIDHTVPFNHTDPAKGGLTVPWNLKCLCRLHHRLKTFLCGPGGWRDRQLPDGTIDLDLTDRADLSHHAKRTGAVSADACASLRGAEAATAQHISRSRTTHRQGSRT